MNFRSLDDMNRVIRRSLNRIPVDVDVVVGVPRSGLIPASVMALHRNLALTDVDGLIAGRVFQPGGSREKPSVNIDPASWKKVLVVDDSILSGATLERVRERLNGAGRRWDTIFCAVYGTEWRHRQADFVLEICARPRVFEWNFMHHAYLSNACVDLDGVLCKDPSRAENDDGPAYEIFLRDACPYLLPTVPIGTLVSCRLERYRPQTEDWLRRHKIKYRELRLMDLPSAAERRRLGLHASFKSEVYRSDPASVLFVESDPVQAEAIAANTGKAVLCIQDMVFFGETAVARLHRRIAKRGAGMAGRLGSLARLLGTIMPSSKAPSSPGDPI